MKDIISNFKVNGNVVYCEKYGEGHINDTYLVILEENDIKTQYILQRINHNIFKDIDGLMNNIYNVTNHIKNILIKENKDISKEVLNVILTKDNKYYHYDENENKYYRLYDFVKNSLTIQKVENSTLFKKSAIAFATFQKNLADFDSTILNETIKDFHNTAKRYEHFIETLSLNKCDRAKYCKDEIEFIKQRKNDCYVLINKIANNEIPLRVTHNDTKLNNVLFDNDTLEATCVIDLDTVMPGSALYDFGDSIRFGCNTASEDEKDLSKVNFSKEYFKAYAEGYLSILKDVLNKEEINNLVFASKMMTLECGIRFLDDYLDGDNYFKIHRENHNLDRCRTQLKLVEEIERYFDELNEIVNEITN